MISPGSLLAIHGAHGRLIVTTISAGEPCSAYVNGARMQQTLELSASNGRLSAQPYNADAAEDERWIHPAG